MQKLWKIMTIINALIVIDIFTIGNDMYRCIDCRSINILEIH